MVDEKVLQSLAEMEGPLAGESLTNDPDNPLPFEKAPQHTDMRKALESIFQSLIEPEAYTNLMLMLSAREFSIMDATQVILKRGFMEGLWNPDLMLILIEPVAYLIMALAEQAQIKFNIVDKEEEEKEAQESYFGISEENETLKNIKRGNFSVPQAILPVDVEDRIEKLPTLEETQEQQPSLLAPNQG